MVRHWLNPGARFANRFEVEKMLGRGSMGTVYLARPLDSEERVALKLMHSDVAEDAKSARRFEREARAGMSIESDHIARVVSTGEDSSGAPWIAMQYAEGPHLDAYVEAAGGLERKDALEILRQLFRAMSAAHRAGVVHRDLKPDNIIVQARDGHPHVVVLDFGIAKTLGTATAIQTKAGQGTPLWTAPEQARDDDVPSPRSDVWALGLLAFYVLTSKLYWIKANERASPLDLAMELLRGELEPATVRAEALGCADAIPDGFDEWFARAVVREPLARHADAILAREALTRVLDDREQTRRAFWLPVQIPQLKGGLAISHDVSEGGLLLVSASELPVGTKIDMTLRVPPETGHEFHVSARVVRSARNDANPNGLWPYKLAVAFDDKMPELDRLLAELESPAQREG